LFAALGEWSLNEPQPPVVVANLVDADKHFPGQTKAYAVKDVKDAGVKVGVTSVVGPTVQERVAALTRGDKTVQFGASDKALDAALKGLDAEKAGLRVLLYQGLLTRNRLGRPPTEA